MRRAEVGEDVAEHVGGDEHVEALGRAHHLHRRHVDVEVRRLDVGVLALRPLRRCAATARARRCSALALSLMHSFLRRPRAASNAARRMRSTPLRVLTSSLMAISSARALLEVAADAGVEALGVLAEHEHVDVRRALALERRQPLVEQPHRAQVDVEVELEAQAEQDVARVHLLGHARIAERAEQDRRVVIAQLLDRALGQRGAVAQPALGAPVELDQLERPPQRGRRRASTRTASAVTSTPMPSPGMTAISVRAHAAPAFAF